MKTLKCDYLLLFTDYFEALQTSKVKTLNV